MSATPQFARQQSLAGRNMPPKFVLNVTAAEFEWLQELKTCLVEKFGDACRDEFYRRMAIGLRIEELGRVERITTVICVRRDCLSIPCAGVPRIERLLPS